VDQRTILLIDDDVELCSLIREYLGRENVLVESAYDGRKGLSRALTGSFDLVILDGMLPALDGLDVLRQLRQTSSVPVIMLTARTQELDRIKGLDSGADDYLPKPFMPAELSARIRAVLRRFTVSSLSQAEILAAGNLEINTGTRVVTMRGVRLDVTEIEVKILEVLVRSLGRAVSRDQISTVLYQRASTPFERGLDVHVSHLRKKVESDGQLIIQTVRGVGYLLAVHEGESI